VFHFAQAKENIYFPSLLICAAQLLSSLSAPWTYTVVSIKAKFRRKKRRKIMETKEKELNLPIGFLRSFQDEYFDRNGKQLLQSVFCIVLYTLAEWLMATLPLIISGN